MAQRKQLSWTDLKVGLFVLVGLIVVGTGVFYVTGAGSSLSPKYRLYTYLPEVDALTLGAPVRLDGVDVGNVDSVQINPHPADKMQSIRVTMRIDKRYQSYIRSGSVASLETEGLLGNRYLTISRSLGGTPVPAEGNIPGSPESSIKEVAERGMELESSLSDLTDQVKAIIGDVQSGRGTLGKLVRDPSLYNNVNATVAHAEKILAATQQGEGTLGKLVSSDELYNKANSAIDHVDNITGAIQDQKGTAGKLIYDSAVYDSAKKILDHGSSFIENIQDGKGTLGRLATDDTLYNNARDAAANVSDLTAKLSGTTGSAGKFVNDPQLYNGLTKTTDNLNGLIDDFRKNPKKFLRIKMSIF